MNRFRFYTLAGIVVSATMSVSAQTSAPASSAAPAASQTATISGCMQESWGRLLVSNNGTAYDVKGSGVDLSAHANHAVTVRGLPDTKATNGQVTPFYALQVQDTGTCGPNGAVASAPSAQPIATPQAVAQPNAVGAQQTPAASQPATQPASPQQEAAATNTQATTQGTTSQAATSMGPENQPGGGAAAAVPAAQQQSNYKTFQGCLSGDMNNYQLKSPDGKTYRLQGNTTMLKGMSKHQVELTGEDFNGKAIEVNGGRDLGSTCSK